mmetsp:Transcript_15099/g.25601  ORF Transcript_15099/g.25601 Transcript_15099/m.25601 type:complete len:81 (+) Transcript_15099:843-1085(+)
MTSMDFVTRRGWNLRQTAATRLCSTVRAAQNVAGLAEERIVSQSNKKCMTNADLLALGIYQFSSLSGFGCFKCMCKVEIC